MELIVNERISNNVEVMKKVKLQSVCKINNGFAFKSEDYKETGIPLLRISNINNGIVSFADDTICVSENYLETKKDFIVEKGDVVIALSGATTGKYGIYINDEPALLNQRIGIIKSNSSKKLNSKYFYFYLNVLKDEILRKAGGAAQPNISTKEISNLEIPLPTLPTQKKIANILDTADQLRQYNKQLIEKYDALTQSLFLEMFGDPVRNEKRWEVSSIRELCSEVKYGTSEKSIENGTFSYLRMNNITYGGYMDFSNLKYIDIPEKDLHKYLVKKGDILFNRTNSKELVGKTGLITTDHEYIIAGYLIRVRTNELANPYYIWAHLNSKWSKMTLNNMCKNIVGMANINAQELQDIQILKAPILLQNQFAERVQIIETQKQQAQEALAKSEDLFQSLLQRAFTGELN